MSFDTITLLFDGAMKPPHNGWILESNAGVPVGEATFELIHLLRDDEEIISSDGMVKRAKEEGVDFNQQVAEKMLANHEKIPESWRKFLIIFSGTSWRSPFGYRFVPYLKWNKNNEHWFLGLFGFELGCSRRTRFLRLQCK